MLMEISRQPSSVQVMTYQKQQENVECFNYLGSMTANDARWTSEIKSSIAMIKKIIQQGEDSFHQHIGLNGWN